MTWKGVRVTCVVGSVVNGADVGEAHAPDQKDADSAATSAGIIVVALPVEVARSPMAADGCDCILRPPHQTGHDWKQFDAKWQAEVKSPKTQPCARIGAAVRRPPRRCLSSAGRSPGSRVSASIRLPGKPQWPMEGGSPLTVAGAATDRDPAGVVPTAFPFDPTGFACLEPTPSCTVGARRRRRKSPRAPRRTWAGAQIPGTAAAARRASRSRWASR